MDTNLALIKTHTRRRTGSTGNWEPAQGGDVSARHVAAGVGGKVGGVASPADTMRIPQPAQQPERQPHEIWILPQKHRHTSDRSPGARRHPAAERRDARNGRIHHRAHPYRHRSRSSIARSTCGHSFANCSDTAERTISCNVGGDVASGWVCSGDVAAGCACGAGCVGSEAVNAARMPASTSASGATSPTVLWIVTKHPCRSSQGSRENDAPKSAGTIPAHASSRRLEVLRIPHPLNRYEVGSCRRPIGSGEWLFFFKNYQFRPDFVPIVGPKVLPGNCSAGGALDRHAALDRNQTLSGRPLRNQHRRRPDCRSKLDGATSHFLCPFTQFHAHIISDARRYCNSDA